MFMQGIFDPMAEGIDTVHKFSVIIKNCIHALETNTNRQ